MLSSTQSLGTSSSMMWVSKGGSGAFGGFLICRQLDLALQKGACFLVKEP
jgi:hypothetical protein